MPRRPRLGQHFLVDERVVERTVGYAELDGSETVLEVGPGRGILTRSLAAAAGEVVAVELDRDLLRELEGNVPGNVRLIQGDAVDVDLPGFDVCVSNLPYEISSPFTFRLLGLGFERAVLMYQREFADRLVAAPGSGGYGRLSVNAQVRADVEVLERVPPGAFSPPPQVESALVRVVPTPFRVDADPEVFEAVVHAAFQHRRKTLGNALAAGARVLGVDRDVARAWKPDLPHGRTRPGKLAPAELAEVARWVTDRGVEPSVRGG